MNYEVLFYDNQTQPPAYYPIDSIKGTTPEEALRDNLPQITQKVRDLFHLTKAEYLDENLQETIYVLRDGGLVSAEEAIDA